jgi:hypothetical protein
MGMDQTVVFAGSAPAWPEVARLLQERGYPVQMRMIDGELAFPDEQPPESWREIRLGTPQGMVTLRRQKTADGEALVFVTWGNAGDDMRRAWNALTWACAVVGKGVVQGANGSLDPAAFARQADLPAELRTSDPGG